MKPRQYDLTPKMLAIIKSSLITLNESYGSDPNAFFENLFCVLKNIAQELYLDYQFLVTTENGLILTNNIFMADIREGTNKNQDVLNYELIRLSATSSMFNLFDSGFNDARSLYQTAISSDFPLFCRSDAKYTDRGSFREFEILTKKIHQKEDQKEKKTFLRIPSPLRTDLKISNIIRNYFFTNFVFTGIRFPVGRYGNSLYVFVHIVDRQKGTISSENDFTVPTLIAVVFANEISEFLVKSASSMFPEDLANAFQIRHWKRFLSFGMTHVSLLKQTFKELKRASNEIFFPVIRETIWEYLNTDPKFIKSGISSWKKGFLLEDDTIDLLETIYEELKPISYFQIQTSMIRKKKKLVTATRKRTKPRLYCFFSGRGGVGKTCLAWRFAHNIASKGKTCLVEADLIEPSLRYFIHKRHLKKISLDTIFDRWFTAKYPPRIDRDQWMIQEIKNGVIVDDNLHLLISNPSRNSRIFEHTMGAIDFGQVLPAFKALYKALQELGYSNIVVDAPCQTRELSVAAIMAFPHRFHVIYVTSTFSAAYKSIDSEPMWRILEENNRISKPYVTIAFNKLRPLEQIYFRSLSSSKEWLQRQNVELNIECFSDVIGFPWIEELERHHSSKISADQLFNHSLNRLILSVQKR